MIRTFTSDEIRDTFLEFFVEKNHTRIDSASVIPVNDPSLLFVNAGMAPLKRYFLGEVLPPAPDLCNVQPCVRTNDITDVGDRHHLTFFEMLGSWSIDNYFKERAVELAFELLTERFGFPADKLYVTVYQGDPALGLPPDDVSAAAWERVGIARDHIVYLGEDNFWSTGDTGPCGPCTEVFYDTGAEHGEEYRPGGEFDTTSRYIEIWNAGVFMEFDKRPDGRFERLRFPSVDTGSGLERMAMVLQGHGSAYETDLFAPIVRAVREGLGGASASERDVRIISDHIRSSTFMLSEGVVPSNDGRGYIPRRLLRKAIAVATRSGFQDIDVPELADVAIDRLKGAYPQLGRNRDRTLELLGREQRDFGRVVRRGLDQLSGLATGPGFRISGEEAFNLYATQGMPVDLIRDFAAEQGGSVDEARFTELFSAHRELSRGGAGKSDAGAPKGAVRTLAPAFTAAVGSATTEFLGYERLDSEARVLAVAGPDGPDGPADSLAEGEQGLVVVDRTPFYPEGGGQVGDTGTLTGPQLSAEVTDTRRIDGHHVHLVQVTKGVLRAGDTLELAVDAPRRRATMRNHSATHLLHAALREVLGDQVRQAGSLVAPDRLRFDFEHPQALTEEETDQVERLVNARVLVNAGRDVQVKPYQDAVRDGAIAFFGDKYGEDVRVVSFGDVSSELCGGTHVNGTAEIGLFRIVGEGSVGAGVRRIEALTGEAALAHTLDRDRTLKQVAGRLRVSVEQLPARIEALTAKEHRPARQNLVSAQSLAAEVREPVPGRRYVLLVDPPLEPKQMADEAGRLGAELNAAVLFLLPDGAGALRIGVGVPSDGPGTAKELLERVLAVTGGRGGGSARFAQGGNITVPLAEAAAAVHTVLEGAAA
ncbi:MULTISPECIES: alanine--tRNA ligase [Streptomyces]|uniref:alanine--tRNA ligase n=1 Tax=Streptomyces TaxID=1883 RepID=UPI0029D31CE0|nr:alanine--tRNA ligase [Streptomyces sp. F8]MDX6757875.1 alanine--tRNA ligase [Streptomyces sp. F8]